MIKWLQIYGFKTDTGKLKLNLINGKQKCLFLGCKTVIDVFHKHGKSHLLFDKNAETNS